MNTDQRAFMEAKHPEVAKRWMHQAGQGSRTLKNANPQSPNPKVPSRTNSTDFKGLVPGQYARHTGRASEKQAMQEGSGIPTFPSAGKGFRGRDVRKAAVAFIKKGG